MNETLTAVSQLVSSIGFPIVMVGVLLYYIYTVMNPMIKALNEILDRLDDMQQEMEELEKKVNNHE